MYRRIETKNNRFRVGKRLEKLIYFNALRKSFLNKQTK